MNKCQWLNSDLGLLILRIGLAIIFIFAGWMKVSNLAATVAQFQSMGFAPFWTYVASFTELIAGVLVLFGLFTRFAAGLLTITMIVALSVVYKDMTMVMTPLSVFFSSLALFASGAGRFSLDRKIKKNSSLSSM